MSKLAVSSLEVKRGNNTFLFILNVLKIFSKIPFLSYHRDRKQMLDLLHTPPSLLHFLRIKLFLHQTLLLFPPPVPECREVGMNLPHSFFFIFTAQICMHSSHLLLCEFVSIHTWLHTVLFCKFVSFFPQIDPHQYIINLVYSF